MKKYLVTVLILFTIIITDTSIAQKNKWVVGGKIGMNIDAGTGGGVALQIGPVGEYSLNKNMAIGSEFTLNTSVGTPVGWVNYFKYYFDVRGSKIKPYAHSGLGLVFVTGGPFFTILFGGGANFPIAKNLYIPAELQIGPVFYSYSTGVQGFGFASQSVSNTRFIINITSGIRYYIN
jgi:hypothetical protein